MSTYVLSPRLIFKSVAGDITLNIVQQVEEANLNGVNSLSSYKVPKDVADLYPAAPGDGRIPLLFPSFPPLSLSLPPPLSLPSLSLSLSLSPSPSPSLSPSPTGDGRNSAGAVRQLSAAAGQCAGRTACRSAGRDEVLSAAGGSSGLGCTARAPRELGANSARTRRELDAEVGRSAATRGRPARGRAQPTQQRLIVRLGVYGELGGGGGASSAAADGCFIGQLRRKAVSRGCPRTARRRQRPEER